MACYGRAGKWGPVYLLEGSLIRVVLTPNTVIRTKRDQPGRTTMRMIACAATLTALCFVGNAVTHAQELFNENFTSFITRQEMGGSELSEPDKQSLQ